MIRLASELCLHHDDLVEQMSSPNEGCYDADNGAGRHTTWTLRASGMYSIVIRTRTAIACRQRPMVAVEGQSGA